MPSFDDLRALYVNCTLTRGPRLSHTQGLIDRCAALAEKNGVAVETLRLVDFDVAPGVQPDMREHGWAVDDWPTTVWPKIRDADILVIGSPIWLGEPSSVARRFIERLYAMTDETNDRGQPVFYGKAAGAITTGNEDGVKNVNKHVLYALQHLGYTIPPAAETGWIGGIGPGPSYLDEDSGGPQTDYTNRTAAAMTWNLLHLARILKDAGAIPAVGNVTAKWEAGERWGFETG